MKHIFASLCLIVCLHHANAQSPTTYADGLKKVDAQLKLMLANPNQLVTKHRAWYKNGPEVNPQIPIVFKATSPQIKTSIEALGGKVHTQLGNIYTGLIPLHAMVNFAQNKEIVRIEAAEKIKVTNDKAKELTGANLVHEAKLPSGLAYTGKGVIVGVFDGGIDFAHRDFRKKTDSTQTRVMAIWDQTVSDAPAPPNYLYGSEWDNAQLNAALKNPNSINTHDYTGHGTHVTGTAAGLRGMAPDADIIFVKGDLHWDSDSTLYQDTKSLLDGLSYIKEKAALAGKPCVVNLSVGYYLGSPHDGTSLVEQGFDYLVQNNNGFFITVAAGNENGRKQHFGGFELTQDSVWTYIGRGMLYGIVNSQFTDSTFIAFEVDSVVADSNDFATFTTQKTIFNSGWYSITQIKNAVNGITIPALYSNGDTAMMMRVTAADFDATRTEIRIFTEQGRTVYTDFIWDFGIAKLALKGKGKLHAWWENYQVPYIEDVSWYTNYRKDDRLKLSDDNYTMNILACGHKTIAVGASVNLTHYKNLNKEWVNYPDSSGAFADFSNLGPTTDGRIKPDITAPGVNVASSKSRDKARTNYNMIDLNTVVLSGTSMAAPVVTGAIALYLEQNPTANFDAIKAAITGNAIVDTFVTKYGAAPNNHFGYGRLDIYKAMGAPFQTGINKNEWASNNNLAVYPNPTKGDIHFSLLTPNKNLTLSIFNTSGKLMHQASGVSPYTLNVSLWPSGIYFFSLTGEKQNNTGKFVVE